MVGSLNRFAARSLLLLAGAAGLDASAARAQAAPPPWSDPVRAAKLSQAIDRALAEKLIPGAAVAIRQGDARFTRDAGLADIQTGTPPAPGTNFGYRSITKSFVTTVVLQLANEGRIGLDDPVGKYVSGVPNGNVITIRQLAEMRSGLFNYTASSGFRNEFPLDPSRVWTARELLAFAFAERPQFAPGTSYQYSNTNTLVLGEVIGAVTGRTWSEEVRRRLTNKLGLASVVDQGAGAIPAPAAVGYVDGGNGPQSLAAFNGTGTGASGALVGVIDDLERWGKAIGTGATLSKADFVARLKSFGSTKSDPNSPQYDSYGFGMGEISGWIGHTGNGLGFQALVMYDRANDRTISILFNASNADNDAPAHLFSELLAILGWTEPMNQRQVVADGSVANVSPGTVWTGLVSGPFFQRAALYATNGGVAIGTGPVRLAPLQDYVPAIFVTRNGSVLLEKGGTITASPGGDGAYLDGAGGTASLALAGVGIKLNGDAVSGTGIDVRDNGTARLTDVTIGGSALAALHAGGRAPATIVGNGVAIDLRQGHGAWAQENGAISLTDSRILLRGPGYGVLATGAGASIALFGSQVSTFAPGAHGIVLGGGASVSLNGSTVRTAGAESAAVAALPLAVDSVASRERAAPPLARLALTNSTISAASGTAVAAAGVDLSLVASRSFIGGAITRAPGARLDLDLANGSVWTLPGAGAVPSRVDTVANRESSIVFAPPGIGSTSFQRLTVGTYRGEYGTIAMNAYLGAGGAAADRLVVDGGTATGTTRLTVQLAGAGPTRGDGILLVETSNGGETAPTAFSLGARVASGAYGYNLYRGGLASGDDWFLRSTRPGSGGLPDLRPEAAVAAALPSMAMRYGLTAIGSLDDREGGRTAADEPGRGAVWARTFGEAGSWGASGGSEVARLRAFLRDGPTYEADLAGFMAGFDLHRYEPGTGANDVAGLFVGAGSVEGDVDAVYGGRGGRASSDAYSFGIYWTRAMPRAWYVDATMQGTFYDQANTISILGETLKTQGWGLAASLEGGYRIALGSGFTIEPQAQAVYQRLSFDGAADRFGQFAFDDAGALYARVGARLTRDWSLENGRTLTTFARANLWQAFGAGASTTLAAPSGAYPVAFSGDAGGTWGQIGIGASTRLAENASLFASADYNVRLDQDGDSAGGRLGLRVTW